MPEILDLTHLLHNDLPVFPGSEKPLIKQINTVAEHGFAQSKLNLLSHHGTHMDAPSHMLANGKTLDQFGPEQFYGPAVCIDCTQVKDECISKTMLTGFEQAIKEAGFVLLYTGWSDKWGSEAYFSGFPVLSREACEWLCKLNLKGIGLDNISFDRMDSTDYENHLIAFRHNLIIIENLTNLKSLVNKRFKLACFPLKYSTADGSPVRAMAVIE